MRQIVLALPVLLAVLVAAPVQADEAPLLQGEACAEKVLKALGSKVTAADLFALSGVDPALGRGCEPAELARALEKAGFVSPLAEAKTKDALREALLADLERGRASAVLLDAGWRLYGVEDRDAMKKDDALSSLRSLARVRFEPGSKLADPPAGLAPSPAAFALHCRALRKKIPADWPIVIERPFVVTGDGDIPRFSRSTVAWSVKLLKQDYFPKDPAEVITIWLFDGKESYESHTKKFFDEEPTTPYGYYTPRHRALIMNIATGGGTLVHEIVHPFVHVNFPTCPSWFNEGLASLYEQCEEKDGRIHGRTNWRLAGLQKAIKKGNLTSFEKLTGTTSNEFYGDERGTNYAQARYLCYYLQEKGLLVDYWTKWLKDREKDKTGYESLKSVLGEKDMKEFQAKWEKWVAELRFPE